MFLKVSSQENQGEFERCVPLFIYTTSSFHGKVKCCERVMFMWKMLCHLRSIVEG